MKKRILVTGGTGRFGTILKKLKTNYEILFPNKKTLDILKFRSIQKYIKLKKPNIVIHLAGLSRPMNIHDRQIQKSIDLNIVGSSNIFISGNVNITYGHDKDDNPITVRELIKGDYHLEVEGNYTQKIHKNHRVKVGAGEGGGNKEEEIRGNYAYQINDNIINYIP